MDFEKLKEFRNTNNPYCQAQGIRVEEIREGYARVTKTVSQEDLNPAGLAHGGCLFALADTASGAASAAHGVYAVTVNASYQYLRSGNAGDTLTAEAREIKSGKTLCVYDVQIRSQSGSLLGTGTFTYYLLDRPLPL